MMTFVLAFLKRMILKYLTSVALEKVVIIFLGELVKRTDSKVDDKLYDAVFNQTQLEDITTKGD
ncbi:hypothetical protein [Fusobacterium perfoetens]|uniref:hypothetical protein n=1 Tax=Fusobacterium perfoetens TaxID=852 RepID=UPI001F2A5876|nr:hypothetical protein [Fusobacterium perfoetens]MCF2612980.1 hypothetical protein [Fusobacterium perfoetens]